MYKVEKKILKVINGLRSALVATKNRERKIIIL